MCARVQESLEKMSLALNCDYFSAPVPNPTFSIVVIEREKMEATALNASATEAVVTQKKAKIVKRKFKCKEIANKRKSPRKLYA